MQGNGSNFVWSWEWVEQLPADEEQQLGELNELLVSFSLSPNNPDSWRWVLGKTGLFSVKSCYDWLIDHKQHEELNFNVLSAIKQLWKNDVPSKVLVFGWRFLLDRLPTKEALNDRGILLNLHDLSCNFCLQHFEDSNHLFFLCIFIKRVWEEVYKWIGMSLPTGSAGIIHFSMFGDMVKTKKGGRVRQDLAGHYVEYLETSK
ncbi:hypothetical protein TSUD_392100 [Trifolium subterraneum]|uniref:Reverse transcriptase zinc-binding domain-containing protein n=1 Tax=Trifolium subterraneum TaxID=3900 RepID=A0A2Z6MZT1_TRISU|nr:hypothetical protein TSUD_392100 [Trifolium subterraneum]